jgi:hypothetical protein
MKRSSLLIILIATALFSCKKSKTDSPVDDCSIKQTTSVKFKNASASAISITLKRQDQAADVFVVSALAVGDSITKVFPAQLGVLYWGSSSTKNVAYQNVCGSYTEILK